MISAHGCRGPVPSQRVPLRSHPWCPRGCGLSDRKMQQIGQEVGLTVGPTVGFSSVHGFAASLQPDGPDTPNYGTKNRVLSTSVWLPIIRKSGARPCGPIRNFHAPKVRES